MICRVLLNIILILTAISSPFWVTILLFCLLGYIATNPVEILIYAILLDVIFMSGTAGISVPIYTAFAVVVYILVETAKPKLRTRNI